MGQRPTQAGSRLSARLDPPRSGARRGRSGPGKARTAMRWWRRASPAGWTAGNGGEAASRRRKAAAGDGARREPSREGEEAGLGPKSVEDGED